VAERDDAKATLAAPFPVHSWRTAEVGQTSWGAHCTVMVNVELTLAPRTVTDAQVMTLGPQGSEHALSAEIAFPLARAHVTVSSKPPVTPKFTSTEVAPEAAATY
jgi:hypothetical protein